MKIMVGAFWVILAAIYVIFSYCITERYVGGDQVFYRQFYDFISTENLLSAVSSQKSFVGSNEPLYATIMWFGAALGFPKDIYVSVLNGVLLLALVVVLRNYKVHTMMLLLVLSNYYLLVLLTGAERLKIAFLFLLLAMTTKSRWRVLFLTAAPASHYQTLINFISISMPALAKRAVVSSGNSRLGWRGALFAEILALAIVGCFGVALFAFGGTVISKVYYYTARADISFSALAVSVVLFVAGTYVSRRKARFMFMLAPCVVLVAILGPDRMNMVTFIMFFYALMTDGKVNHPIVYLPMVYLSFKSIGYVDSVFDVGHGFRV
ncbi:hypothetical protein JHL21_16040 [Devosia sp. WQ 349]|uniref:EpsG family protein n=1 Tax=Devosia sp. WQ 349K1 TaxID=2800329 RepID=UPI00190430C0|nr:EpsG family protein [Devosia sp. WQ 349K1]MBK1796003.1 hypothetical protein [Devosia sp. WQ 349K1]